MAQGRAAAQATEWVRETKERQRAVLLESAQRAIGEMQLIGPSVANPGAGEGGRMPIGKTGFLRGSLQVALNEPKGFLPKPKSDAKVNYDPGGANLMLASAEITDRIFATYGANYAQYVNYRYQFVGFAADQWGRIVADVCRDLRARAGQ